LSVKNRGAKRTQAVHCATQRRWDASGVGNALGCPRACHSLLVTSGCSVVQNGASSACLNRLSLRARSQLDPRSRVVYFVEVQCAPADCLQHEGLCPVLAQVGSLLDDLDHARLQDLHGPASKHQGVHSLPMHAEWRQSCNIAQQYASADTSAGSSSRRTARGRAAALAVDERVLIWRCGVKRWREYRRRFSSWPVARKHASCCRPGKRSSASRVVVGLSLDQSHTIHSCDTHACAPPSSACLEPQEGRSALPSTGAFFRFAKGPYTYDIQNSI